MHMIDAHHTDSTTAVIISMRMIGVICQITKSIYKQNTQVNGASDRIHLFKKSRQANRWSDASLCSPID